MLKKVLFKHDKYLYFDWAYLKDCFENGRLQGATVFARLFNFIEDGKFLVESDKDVYDLSAFGIYIDDWILLMSFVRNGYLPNFYNMDRNITAINDCYDISIKLGGIPEYDKYYESFTNNDEDATVDIYNPMTPSDDYKGVYTWRVVSHLVTLYPTESITCSVRDGQHSVFFSRRLNSHIS